MFIKKTALLFLSTALICSGCAVYRPKINPEAEYFQRLKSQTQGGVTVKVVGLGARESKKAFGVNLASKHILPVWMEIENQDPEYSYAFIERNVDPGYYTPGEAAYMSKIAATNIIKKFLPPVLHFVLWPVAPLEHLLAKSANEKLEQTFEEHALGYGWIKPGEKRAGYMFVPFEVGLKEITLDLEGYLPATRLKEEGKVVRRFDFIIQIPGIRQDYLKKDFLNYYAADEFQDFEDEAALMEYVKSLPCCTTNKKRTRNGDPLNLVVIGDAEDVLTSFTVAKWDETEELYLGSIMKTISSFSFEKNYRYSPVSPLYFMGRSHDVAFQKARKTIDQRLHTRLWYAPVRFRGKSVWIGTVSRDIGVRFTRKTWNLTTHKIDPDIDESLFYTLNDLIYAKQVEAYGLGHGVPESANTQPAENLTGDPYFTKGMRSVIVLSKIRNEETPALMESEAIDEIAKRLSSGASAKGF